MLKDPWSMAVRLPMINCHEAIRILCATGQVAEPCPLEPRPLDGINTAPTRRDPCLWYCNGVCILWNGPCTSSLLTSCNYILSFHHLALSWLVGGTPMTTRVTWRHWIHSPKTCGTKQEAIKVSLSDSPSFNHLRCSTTAPHNVDHQWHALVFAGTCESCTGHPRRLPYGAC